MKLYYDKEEVAPAYMYGIKPFTYWDTGGFDATSIIMEDNLYKASYINEFVKRILLSAAVILGGISLVAIIIIIAPKI